MQLDEKERTMSTQAITKDRWKVSWLTVGVLAVATIPVTRPLVTGAESYCSTGSGVPSLGFSDGLSTSTIQVFSQCWL